LGGIFEQTGQSIILVVGGICGAVAQVEDQYPWGSVLETGWEDTSGDEGAWRQL